jgi:hypothetical protein
MSFQQIRTTRRESRTLVGRFRGGKLAPVMATAVRGNEGGMLSQTITYELDPIAGRMITAMYGEFISVFVPVQAADAIKDPAAAYAGMTEVIREKLLTGNPLFGLEAETEISKRCGVNPRSISGVKKVNEVTRLAHNAAVNYLRQRKYHKAAKILASSTAITPALISQTVLERLNGVLDPDDRINGAVQLDIPSMQLPVAGVGMSSVTTGASVIETDGSSNTYANGRAFVKDAGIGVAPNNNLLVEQTAAGLPMIFAQLNGAAAGNVSLTDFYNAEKMDRLTRTMQQMVSLGSGLDSASMGS